MDSVTVQPIPGATPAVKFEASPAESWLSTPGDMYPSLFDNSTATQSQAYAREMTPDSLDEDRSCQGSVCDGANAEDDEMDGSQKKTKKRKSWGQVLPEPKTNLPPRKRAKTDDEKEQRRVERVLRNRRAAQSSRERKRLEVEALEEQNKELQMALEQARSTNLLLMQELNKTRRDSGATSSFDNAMQQHNSLTFSQSLFGAQEGAPTTATTTNPQLLDELLMSAQTHKTINPSTISPALSPVAEEIDLTQDDNKVIAASGAPVDISPDLTQHPAAMLCSRDLQCQSAEVPRSHQLPQSSTTTASRLSLSTLQWWLTTVLLVFSQRPLMQIATSLKAGSSLHPTRPILNTIIWLVTRPKSPSRRPSTLISTSFSTPTTETDSHLTTTSTSTTPRSSRSSPRPTLTTLTSLRPKILHKILTRSPALARPLMDATAEALRLVSSEKASCHQRQVKFVDKGMNEEYRRTGAERSFVIGSDDCTSSVGGSCGVNLTTTGQAVALDKDGNWMDASSCPSREALLTLMWALRVEDRRRNGTTSSTKTMTIVAKRKHTSSKVVKGAESVSFGKRRRMA